MADSLPRRGLASRGPAPYGWRRHRGALLEDRHEQHVRWLILHMRRQGFTLTQIAAELARLNLPTRDGGVTWPKTTVHRVIVDARRLDEAAAAIDTG